MLQKAPLWRSFLFAERENAMDLLQRCAQVFVQLLDVQYHILAGRKGKTVEFTISFEPSDFHHLAGLHKLRDNARLQRGRRGDILRDVLGGRITLEQIQKSTFFHEMAPRLSPLSGLEQFLDSNEIIFRYNTKANVFSVIQADYLLENTWEGSPVYLFLSQRRDEETQVCRTFFPKAGKDYTVGQPRYTLLRKEKIFLKTGERILQHDRLSHSTK